MIQLTFHSAAATDIALIRKWYLVQNPLLDDALAADFSAALQRIQRHPRMYVGVHGIHRVQLHRFPCHIYYVLRDDLIVVVGVIHATADPAAISTMIGSRLP